jgi:hypothetical protein
MVELADAIGANDIGSNSGKLLLFAYRFLSWKGAT